MEITVPYKFQPRDYQLPLFKAMDSGYKRGVVVWHRRSGKDKTLVNLMAKKMLERVGTYYYFFPTYTQGKKILWNGRDKDGFKFLDHIPKELRKRTDNTELLIELVNGSIFQIIGTDRIDTIVGTNPVGCVFSEYSLQNPMAWAYIRPILAENEGWAVFNFTPRGKNHGYTLYKYAEDADDWFCQKLTVDDTKAISAERLESERVEMQKEYGDDSIFHQEYYCSFDAAIQGAYYGRQLKQAEEEKRITRVPYEQGIVVDTFWDLGVADSTAIWFLQIVGNEYRLIDYYEASGEGLGHYIDVLNKRGYTYGEHWAPHDIQVRELGSGKSRLETAREMGLDFRIVPQIGLQDGINAVRALLNKCYFDKDKCEHGLNCLINYHHEYDEKAKIYRDRPEHDWSSHGCLVADTLVETNKGKKRADEISVGDFLRTPLGYKKVLHAGFVKKTNELIIIETDNGNTLKVTPEHKIFTQRGLVLADALRYNDSIINDNYTLCEENSLYSRAKSIGFRESIIEQKTGGMEQATYTGRYGKMHMEKFRKNIISTIKMVIHSITGWKIWNALKSQSTCHTTPRKTNGLGASKTRHSYSKPKSLQKSGTVVKKGGSGTKNMGKNVGKKEFGIKRFARFVVGNIKRLIQQEANIATKIVRLRREGVKSVKVYDFTVEKDHCYYANGLLVSNSDAFRYLAVAAKPKTAPMINEFDIERTQYNLTRGFE